MDPDFTPTIDMLVHEFDDEGTLDEEEKIEPLNSQLIELADLQRERDMPLEELLSMYDYNFEECAPEMPNVDENVSHKSNSIESSVSERNRNSNNCDSSVRSFKTRSKQRYLRDYHNSDSNSDGENEDDDDYIYNIEDEEKSVRIGIQYQALVPDNLCPYDDALPYENEDKLLWDPKKLSEVEIVKYLNIIREQNFVNKKKDSQKPSSVFSERKRNNCLDTIVTKDDEQALFLLLLCGFNVEEAVRRQRLNVIPFTNMSLWSEDECTHFENGLFSFGKDFHQIQLHNVRTRTIDEIVQFYYYWKKSERHDHFVSNFRLEKKKYNIHPEITDFMEKCNAEPDIEEQLCLSTESDDKKTNCKNDEYLINSESEEKRPLSHLIDDDLLSKNSITRLRTEKVFRSNVVNK